MLKLHNSANSLLRRKGAQSVLGDPHLFKAHPPPALLITCSETEPRERERQVATTTNERTSARRIFSSRAASYVPGLLLVLWMEALFTGREILKKNGRDGGKKVRDSNSWRKEIAAGAPY